MRRPREERHVRTNFDELKVDSLGGGAAAGPVDRRRLLAWSATGLAVSVTKLGRTRAAAAASMAIDGDDPEPDPEAVETIGSPAAGEGTLTLYSGQHPEATRAIAAAFQQRTGVGLEIRSGEDPELANQIILEGDRSPADVFFAANSPALMLLSERDMLVDVDSETLEQIPERFDSPEGDWVGVAARATALVYNPSLLSKSDLPSSLLDLADPAWQGRIGIAPAEGDFQPVVSAVIKAVGEEQALSWASGLAENAETYQGNTAILEEVERGELAAGIINHYYWFRRAEEVGGANMTSELYYFGHGDPGALVNVSGAGILKSSEQPELGQQFLTFLVSKEGQQALVQSKTYEYPLGSDVEPSPELKPFDELDPPDIGPGDLGDGRQAVELLQDAGLL